MRPHKLFMVLSQVLNAYAFQSMSRVWSRQRPSLSRHSYANTVDPPQRSEQEAGNDFEREIRELNRRQKEQKRTNISNHLPNPLRVSRRPSFLRQVSSLREYKLHVADETERISVVRFFSPYCRSCKAATPAFDLLAHQYPDLNWVEVPVTKNNAALHQGLGVPSVPYGHIYVPGSGLVEELRMVRPQMQRFGQILQSYADGQCDLPDDTDRNTGIYEAPY